MSGNGDNKDDDKPFGHRADDDDNVPYGLFSGCLLSAIIGLVVWLAVLFLFGGK